MQNNKFFSLGITGVTGFGLIVFMIFILLGCNLSSSETEIQVSNPPLKPSVKISNIRSSGGLTTNGEYYERDSIEIALEVLGSQYSSVACEVFLQKLSSEGYVNTPNSPMASCQNLVFNFDSGTGLYRLLAKVTDANSKTAETQRFLLVVPKSISDQPYLQAIFNHTTSSLVENAFEVLLDATPSKIGETGDIVSYTWQYRLKQDPETSTITLKESGPITSVVFQSDGIYVVKLTVTDAGGKTASMTQQFGVGLNQPISLSFTFSNGTSVAVPGTTAGAPTAFNLQVDASGSVIAAGVDHYIWQVYKSDALDDMIYEIQTETPTTTLPLIDAGVTYLIKLRVIDQTGNEHAYSQLVSI